MQYSTAVRNAKLEVVETIIGTSPILKIFSGSKPANCASASSGVILATLVLPVDWLGPAASGVKSMSGSWADSAADNSGNAAHYRLFASDGVTCHQQGTVTGTGLGGDMTVDNVVFTSGQPFLITAYQLTAGNA